MSFGKFKEWFDGHALTYLDRRIEAYKELTADPFILDLVMQVRHLLEGGKRVRPYVCALAYQMGSGKKPEEILDVLIGLELFHTFCLIHDDVIDLGDTRRGVETVHELAGRKMKQLDRRGDLSHVANGQAMLVGDLVFSWAEELFYRQHCDDEIKNQVQKEFRRMIDEVVIGQMIDVDVMTRSKVEKDRLIEKMMLKTASYTFIRPLSIGFALAGALDQYREFAEKFGSAIGTAFQIQDDLLDLTVTEEEFKKTVLSDVQDGQHTLFSQFIFEQGTEEQRLQLQSVFGARLSEDKAEAVRKLFIESGAIAYGREEMDRQFEEARRVTNASLAGSEQWEHVLELVEMISARTS